MKFTSKNRCTWFDNSRVKNDAAHFCVTQGKKMQIVDLKTEGAGLHGVARLTFKCGE